jgi:hypothetical protein
MDESHYQSLDEERRRYSDEEQGNKKLSKEKYFSNLPFKNQ